MTLKLLPGHRFNRLILIELDIELTKRYKTKYWKCRCDCGNLISVRQSHLTCGNVQSCKCLAKELTSKRAINQRKFPLCRDAAKTIFREIYNDGDLVFEDFLFLSQQKCYYCKCKPSNKRKSTIFKKIISEQEENERYFIYNGLDRIDPTKPHNKNNIITCCFNCNRAKSNYNLNEFIKWIKRIKQFLFIENNIEKINEKRK